MLVDLMLKKRLIKVLWRSHNHFQRIILFSPKLWETSTYSRRILHTFREANEIIFIREYFRNKHPLYPFFHRKFYETSRNSLNFPFHNFEYFLKNDPTQDSQILIKNFRAKIWWKNTETGSLFQRPRGRVEGRIVPIAAPPSSRTWQRIPLRYIRCVHSRT